MARDKILGKIESFWWVGVVIVLVILFFVPAKVGLPHRDYKGCERKTSLCVVGNVKSFTKIPKGSMVVEITTPAVANITEKETDVKYKLSKFNDRISVGNKVVMDFDKDRNGVSLFIEKDTKLLWKLAEEIFSVWHAPNIVDLDTSEEING